jgi:general stress protein 26
MAETPVQKLDELVEGIKIALMTTRRGDGHLVSRPMALQKKEAGADFWFVTERDGAKVRELRRDPHVNLGFYKDRTREYVSVAGTAVLTDDRAIIRRLWAPDWKAWFADEGGARDGSAEDPRLFLIGVKAHSVHFLSVDKPQPVVLFELLKAVVGGRKPDIGRVRSVSGVALHRKRGAAKRKTAKRKTAKPRAATKKR